MTAVESHSTTHVSRTRIAQLGDELMSTLTFVTPDTRFPPTGAKYKPALVDINYRATGGHTAHLWVRDRHTHAASAGLRGVGAFAGGEAHLNVTRFKQQRSDSPATAYL